MSNSLELVTECFATCAESLGDITPQVFERFFAHSGDAASLMQHSDEYMRGRMMEQTLELLMSDEHFGEDGYLAWELDNHLHAYQATPAMYGAFFAAIGEVLEHGTGAQWNAVYREAWDHRVDLIMQQVYAHDV